MYAGKIFTLAPKPLVPKKNIENWRKHLTKAQNTQTKAQNPISRLPCCRHRFPLPPFFTFDSFTDHDHNSSLHRRFFSQA
jgi:hypothetical protein